MIQASLSIRIPELWVTAVGEKYDAQVSCRIGGSSETGGWGLVTIKADEEVLDDIIDEIKRHPSVGNVTIKDREEDLVSLAVDVVKCRPCEVLIKSKSFMVFPVEIRKDRMTWVIITDTNKTLGGVRDELEKLGADVELLRVASLRDGEVMTKRQEQVIREAFALGFFDFPRKTNSEDLAKALGISVSTLSEILRAAERRILGQHLRM